MPIPIRESDAIKLASLIHQCVALKDDVLPSDLEPEEIKLVVDRRRAKLLLGIENLGLQMKPDLPIQEKASASTELVMATSVAAPCQQHDFVVVEDGSVCCRVCGEDLI